MATGRARLQPCRKARINTGALAPEVSGSSQAPTFKSIYETASSHPACPEATEGSGRPTCFSILVGARHAVPIFRRWPFPPRDIILLALKLLKGAKGRPAFPARRTSARPDASGPAAKDLNHCISPPSAVALAAVELLGPLFGFRVSLFDLQAGSANLFPQQPEWLVGRVVERIARGFGLKQQA